MYFSRIAWARSWTAIHSDRAGATARVAVLAGVATTRAYATGAEGDLVTGLAAVDGAAGVEAVLGLLREVARLGIFGHAADEAPLVTTMNRDGWELARQVSRRLGWLPPASVDIPA